MTHRLVCDLSAVGDGDAAARLLGDGPGAGFNTVVVDLLFDFQTCPQLLKLVVY